MVEQIIRECMEKGFFAQQQHGEVYQVMIPGVRGINGVIQVPNGLDLRHARDFIMTAQELKIKDAYVVNYGKRRYGSNRSILSLVGTGTPYRTPVSIVANHGITDEKLQALYLKLIGF